jgi:hypothetical protein
VVNLCAAPTDESNIRGRVEQGDEVIELTSEGNWIGIRVLPTGEEGWIYGRWLDRVAQSGLLPGDSGFIEDGDGGFLQLSEGFDRLIRRSTAVWAIGWCRRRSSSATECCGSRRRPPGCGPRAAKAT